MPSPLFLVATVLGPLWASPDLRELQLAGVIWRGVLILGVASVRKGLRCGISCQPRGGFCDCLPAVCNSTPHVAQVR